MTRDYKILTEWMSKERFIPFFTSETELIWKIKEIMNNVIDNNEIKEEYVNVSWRKEKIRCRWHSNYKGKERALMKINQLRLKHWYFKPLKV